MNYVMEGRVNIRLDNGVTPNTFGAKPSGLEIRQMFPIARGATNLINC